MVSVLLVEVFHVLSLESLVLRVQLVVPGILGRQLALVVLGNLTTNSHPMDALSNNQPTASFHCYTVILLYCYRMGSFDRGATWCVDFLLARRGDMTARGGLSGMYVAQGLPNVVLL